MTKKTVEAAPAKTTTRKKKVADPSVVEAPKKAPAKPATSPKKKAAAKSASVPVISADERHRLIEVAAYYLAERRGFHGASSQEDSQEDWLQAEQDIDAMIAAGKFGT